jgi:hypothetical protein
MNTAYKSEKLTLMAVVAVLALSVVFIGAIADGSDAAKAQGDDVYGGAELPVRNIDFDVTLGYESYLFNPDYYFNYVAAEVDNSQFFYDEEGNPCVKFWTASFDFSNSIPDGKYWPYGSDAVIAVTFYFSDGTESDIGNIKASKTVCYPVFEVNGIPYVEDVICTPDLWPSDGRYAYPVQVEAVIYTSLFNDSAVNGQY